MTTEDDLRRLTNNHRLVLTRQWIGTGGTINWIMLNPSMADDVFDDPTIRRCVGFSKRWGFSGLVVTNLFTFRATDPRDLKTCAISDWSRAVGLADGALIEHAKASDLVVAAWGIHGNLGGRADDVRFRVLPSQKFHCIGKTKLGFPLHPVMAGYTEAPQEYEWPL